MRVRANNASGGGKTEVERVVAGQVTSSILQSTIMKNDAKPYKCYTSSSVAVTGDYIDWRYANSKWTAKALQSGDYSYWNKGTYSAPQHYDANDVILQISGWSASETDFERYGVSVSAWA